MKEDFLKVYDRFKLDFYRTLNFGDGKDALTVSESFCLEVIKGLENATVRDVALFMKISQPNAAYKISNLEEKGYITKTQSSEDKRIFYLEVTDKYDEFYKRKNAQLIETLNILEEKFSKEDLKTLQKVLRQINDTLPSPNDYFK